MIETSEVERPLIVGMNNPVSLDPRYALYPLPVGCAGNRLFEMMRAVRPSTTMSEYALRFDRVNLVVGTWDLQRAKSRAEEMRASLAGRRVVLLGREVARAFGVPVCAVGEWHVSDEVVFYSLPHPSGRNLRYNDPALRVATGRLLADLCDGR